MPLGEEMMVVPGRREMPEGFVPVHSQHDDHAPMIVRAKNGGLVSFGRGSARLLDERFVRRYRSWGALGRDVQDVDRPPRARRKNDDRAAGFVLGWRMTLS